MKGEKKVKFNDAIKTLDEVIPPPDHPTVDLDHLPIAQAWETIKDCLHNYFLICDILTKEIEK